MEEWLGDNAWAVWLGLTIVLGGLEMLSLDLVLLMLAVGAGIGLLSALLGAPLVVQGLLAAAASLAALTLIRPGLLRRLHSGPELALGHGKLVGTQGLVVEPISSQQHGRVRLAGEIWSAAPYDDFETIAAGEMVEVLEIRGATAYVHPVPRIEP